MKYLKLFKTDRPIEQGFYISYTEDKDIVRVIEKQHDYSTDYLTFVAKSSGIFRFSGASTAQTISYSTDNGETWSESSQIVEINVKDGDKVLWKGTMTPIEYFGIGSFNESTTTFDIEGNIMSLLYGDNYIGQIDLSGKNYAFYQLFGSTECINADNLILLASTLAESCYSNMFQGCTSLTKAPELMATILEKRCYISMFRDCTSLVKMPQIHATTANISSCASMFDGCINLKETTDLMATTLSGYCYESMFNGCTSLTQAPQLYATTLTNGCYHYMFQGCTSLRAAPDLLATELASFCYEGMFENCTNLNYIKMLAIDISKTSCLNNWVNGVAENGTFIKNSEATWDESNVIPNGWTVETE